MESLVKAFIYGLFVFFIVVILLGAFWAFLIMLLWNELIPKIFDGREINFWQAWGLYFLCSLLFKSYSIQTKK